MGRTGTYIAIDAMMEKIKQEGKIDIYQFVCQMRRERHLMVQTVVCLSFEQSSEEKNSLHLETICLHLSNTIRIFSLWKYEDRRECIPIDLLKFEEE